MARPKTAPIPFEEALQELQTLVVSMEQDTLPLETLISHYERGAQLLNHCQSVLVSAKKRLEILQNPPAATPQEDADIRLI